MTDLEFIENIESRFFRTEHDTGANFNALFIWNLVREHAGLPKLDQFDLTIGEEYTQGIERPYPVMPRPEEELDEIHRQRARERTYEKSYSGEYGIVHLYHKDAKEGDSSLCATILEKIGKKRIVKSHDYVCPTCKFIARGTI